ncbi:hypothetical protein SAMN02745192_1521 [Xylanibacter ruminicola]|nr:hypothetical protein SAMN02745192_1521 [Xylanibacter ruminicola]
MSHRNLYKIWSNQRFVLSLQANQQLVDMPVDKQVLLRYRVLNRCFRNPFTEYTLDDLVEECNKSLVAEFNKQVGSRAWTSLRGLHDSVLIDTLIAKGVDVSAVYDGVTISFKRKIALNADKTKVVFA